VSLGFKVARGRDLLDGTVNVTRNAERLLAGPLCIAAGYGDCRLDHHARNVWKLAGRPDLAQDEELPVLHDVDSHLRVFDVLCAKPRADRGLQLVRRLAARLDVAHQRHRDPSLLINHVEPRQVRLAIDENAQPLARIENVGPLGIVNGLSSNDVALHYSRRAPGNLFGNYSSTRTVLCRRCSHQISAGHMFEIGGTRTQHRRQSTGENEDQAD
jgi:hypothetical protein